MKRVLKWLGIGVGVLISLGVLAAAGVYVLSERAIHRQYDVPLSSIVVPKDADSLVRGKRLATIHGCFNSCHGKRMEGTELYDEPGIAKINAPNLTHILREYTDAQLERLIRHGVKRDGTSTWIMPAPMFSRLSDEDLGAIVAFVRSVPVVDGPMRETTIRPLGRIGIVTGKFRPLASEVEPGLQHTATTDRSSPLALGQYLVKTTCTECHGADLKGSELVNAPSLVVSSGYSDEALERLLHTGIAIGGRTVGMMTEVAQTRFPGLTEDEVAAIRTYLRTQFAPAPQG